MKYKCNLKLLKCSVNVALLILIQLVECMHQWLYSKRHKNYDLVCFTDLEEAALPLDEYASLRHFFVRSLKEGSRPIDRDPRCLVTGNQLLGHPLCPICFTLNHW